MWSPSIDIWQYLEKVFIVTIWVVLLATNGDKPGILIHTYKVQKILQTNQKNDPIQNVSGVMVEKKKKQPDLSLRKWPA